MGRRFRPAHMRGRLHLPARQLDAFFQPAAMHLFGSTAAAAPSSFLALEGSAQSSFRQHQRAEHSSLIIQLGGDNIVVHGLH